MVSLVWLMLAATATTLALGASPPPEVVRVRVPSESLGTWFPAGTGVRGLTSEEFDQLVQAATEQQSRRTRPLGARILRARHHAQWNSGGLTGHSELTVEAPPGEQGKPAELSLHPWSPAIDSSKLGSTELRMSDAGQASVLVPAGAVSTVRLSWQLRARPGSLGRGFSLNLPETEVSELTLDLPQGWIPEGPGGLRAGPSASKEPGRENWMFNGRGGALSLQLHGQRSEEDLAQETRSWLSGPTRIELGESLATWVTEATVTLDPRASRRIQLELDPGLEFVGVTGESVEESSAEKLGDSTRVTVLLRAQIPTVSKFQVQAVTSVPAEGEWVIPSARPLDATWTGGTTSIVLDASRVLRGYKEATGRRIPARAANSALDSRLIVFEADAPRSVATLTFAKPKLEATVEVRGQLLLGNSAPRLECQLTWRVHKGPLLALDVDLPPAWVPDRLQVLGVDEPLVWYPRSLPGGGVRVHVTPPSADLTRSALVLNLHASASIAGGRGPLTLPRVRPTSGQVVDERWLAWTESGVTLHPTKAQGVAWISPSLVIGDLDERAEVPTGLREALAWRWISDQAEARVDREREQEGSRGSVQLNALVDRDRVRYEWKIEVDTGEESLRSIPIHLDGSLTATDRWTFRDELTSANLALKPVDRARRSELGLPESGEAWEIPLPNPSTGLHVVRSSLELPWKGEGELPLVSLPARFRSRHFVSIEVARDLLSRVESTDLQDLDPKVAAEAMATARNEEKSAPTTQEATPRRRAHAYCYTKPGGVLKLWTEALEPASNPGVIDQATLTSFIDPSGPLRNRLALRISIADARTLDLTLPPGSHLLRIRRDGQAILPPCRGESMTLPLPPVSATRGFCSYVLDYSTPRREPTTGGSYRPERPIASLPYLGLRWEVVLPDPWMVDHQGPSLISCDPYMTPSGLERLLPLWPGSRAASSKRERDLLISLDTRVLELTREEMTLGECLTRWDGGFSPIVVDRLALESGGWGPRSMVAPPHADQSTDPPGQSGANAILRPLGLCLVPIGETLLLTSRLEAPDRPGGPFQYRGARPAWEQRLRQAVVNGSDLSDRFQIVARWRAESARKVQFGGETTDIDPTPVGRRTWRFTTIGWPESGMTIHLVNATRERANAWAAAAAILILGLAARAFPLRSRAFAVGLILFVQILVLASTQPRPPALALGALAGVFLLVFYEMGIAIPRWSRARPLPLERQRGGRSSVAARYRPGPGVATLLILGLGAIGGNFPSGLSRAWSAVAPPPLAPILALYPYEEGVSLKDQPSNVVLRLDDFERLKQLATPAEPIGSGSTLRALAATHRLTWQGAGGVVIDSEIELVLVGESPGVWRFPIGRAREISATLDDVDQPVRIEPGGRSATVEMSEPGRKTLRIRRFVTPRQSGDEASVSLPINPLAPARVEVSAGPAGRRVEIPEARGAIVPRAGGAAGLLGPVSQLDVQWVPMRDVERRHDIGSVESLILWDAEPAGDHVRVRLNYRNPEGTSEVRLRLDPRFVVRSSAIPGQADTSIQVKEGATEWIAHVNPPLPDGGTVQLELWRPNGENGQPRETIDRSFPEFLPVGVESYGGILGFRRPPDWMGRLAPAPSTDPITEEVFVKAWGNLPDEPLTLSGVTRLGRSSTLSVRTGPQAPRLSIQSSVQLDLGPGRIELNMEARLTQISGRSYQAEVALPADFQVVRVNGEGLTDWSRTPSNLQLRFDGSAVKQRNIQIQGWLPVAYNPLAAGSIRQEAKVPWPLWRDAEVEVGSLVIQASSPFKLETSSGISLQDIDFEEFDLESFYESYRVDQPEGLGLLRWEIQPPRVDVQTRSQLSINPDSVEWVAALRYDVSGGATDTLKLTLPTVWAESAEISLMGAAYQLTSESRGDVTSWTIRPEQPIWGSQDLTIRSVRSLLGTSTLGFPNLEPVINGSTACDLAIVNASGQDFSTEGSPGLQRTNESSPFLTEDFSPLPGLPIQVFRVTGKNWTLKINAPVGTSLASDRSSGLVRSTLTEVEGVVDDEGGLIGSLRCMIENRSSPFLGFSLPERALPLWVSIGAKPLRPLRAPSGRWLVPLEDQSSGQLKLVWKSVPVQSNNGRGLDLGFPRLDQQPTSTFISLRLPATWEAASRSPSLVTVAADRQLIAHAERFAQWLIERIASFDRSSSQDRDALIASMVDFELMLRSAERAAVWRLPPSTSRDLEVQTIRVRIRAARQSMTEAIETAGLDELARTVRTHIGLVPDDPEMPVAELSEPVTPLRLPHLGRPRHFDGEADGKPNGSAPAILTQTLRTEQAASSQPSPVLAWLAIGLPPIVWWLLTHLSRPGVGPSLVLSAMLGLALLTGGPLVFLGAALMTGLGRNRPARE